MNRREVVGSLVVAAAAGPVTAVAARSAELGAAESGAATTAHTAPSPLQPLPYVKGAPIPVAFVVAAGAELVDFAGPWGVFEYVYLAEEGTNPFELYTVAGSTSPIKISGGMTIVPDHTFASAPQPKVIVVPALLGDPSDAMLDWLRSASKAADITMSVCNGAFVIAKAGLLSGKSATSHHGAYALFQADFPDIKVKRGARFVDEGNVATSGGLTSGIDLALHVVARYFGMQAAENAATNLEYQGQGWKDANSNTAFAERPVSTDERPICPVCEMAVTKERSLTSLYRGKAVYLCSAEDKARFDKSPERFF